MNCEKCDREVGSELKQCAFREEGGCPYQVRQVKRSLAGPGCSLAVGVVIAFLALWLFTVPDLPVVIDIVLWLSVLVGVGLVLGGLIAGLIKETELVNQDGEQVWREVTLLGKQITAGTTLGFRKVPWDAHIRKLRFPSSVVELARSGETIQIVSTALVHLLNTGVIEIGVVSTKGSLMSAKEQFFLIPGKALETSEIPGDLEQRMIEVVASSAGADGILEYRGKKYSTSGGPYLSLEDFLLVLFEGEKQFPRSWLMEEVVGKQAVELGFGELGRQGREQVFKFFDQTRSRMDVDKQAVEQMYKELWKSQPLAPELHSQIDYIIVSKIKDKSFFL